MQKGAEGQTAQRSGLRSVPRRLHECAQRCFHRDGAHPIPAWAGTFFPYMRFGRSGRALRFGGCDTLCARAVAASEEGPVALFPGGDIQGVRFEAKPAYEGHSKRWLLAPRSILTHRRGRS